MIGIRSLVVAYDSLVLMEPDQLVFVYSVIVHDANSNEVSGTAAAHPVNQAV